jgi:hypothetical protein
MNLLCNGAVSTTGKPRAKGLQTMPMDTRPVATTPLCNRERGKWTANFKTWWFEIYWPYFRNDKCWGFFAPTILVPYRNDGFHVYRWATVLRVFGFGVGFARRK